MYGIYNHEKLCKSVCIIYVLMYKTLNLNMLNILYILLVNHIMVNKMCITICPNSLDKRDANLKAHLHFNHMLSFRAIYMFVNRTLPLIYDAMLNVTMKRSIILLRFTFIIISMLLNWETVQQLWYTTGTLKYMYKYCNFFLELYSI